MSRLHPRAESGRTRVAVIGGGRSCEHEVSLASAASVAAALDPHTFDVVRLTIGRDGTWHDEQGALGDGPASSLAAAVALLAGCDVALPAVHGPHGEDGTLAALCDLAGIPCVGSGVGAGALAMDKWATKLVAEAVGVSTASGALVGRDAAARLTWAGPVVVKPVAAGSSHGVTLVREPAALAPALHAALAVDGRVLVEEVVVGREIDIAVLELPDGTRRLSPPLEIVVAGGVFDLDQKYDGSADFRIPAPLDAPDLAGLERAALATYDALGCRGVARVDFFLTDQGWVLNEVNTMPGMTEQSQVPRMFVADGLPYPELLTTLVEVALGASSEPSGEQSLEQEVVDPGALAGAAR